MAASSVDFRIGPRNPTGYASFTNTSPTWGSAVAQLGNAWASGPLQAEDRRGGSPACSQSKPRKRAGWAAGNRRGGKTVRDIAMRDPSIIGDTAFPRISVRDTEPEAAPESLRGPS